MVEKNMTRNKKRSASQRVSMAYREKKPPADRLIELLKKHGWNTAVGILKKEQEAG